MWLTNIRKVAERSQSGGGALRNFDAAEAAVVLHYACCTASDFAGK